MATFSSAPHEVSRAGAPPPPHPAWFFAGTHAWLCSRGCFHLQNLEAASPQGHSTKHFCKLGAAGQQTRLLCNSGWGPFPNMSLLRDYATLGRRVPQCWCHGLLSTRSVCSDVCPNLLTGSVGLGHQRWPFGWQHQSLLGGWVWAGGCIWVAASEAVSWLQEAASWACGEDRSMSNPHWCDGGVRALRDILRQKCCGFLTWDGRWELTIYIRFLIRKKISIYFLTLLTCLKLDFICVKFGSIQWSSNLGQILMNFGCISSLAGLICCCEKPVMWTGREGRVPSILLTVKTMFTFGAAAGGCPAHPRQFLGLDPPSQPARGVLVSFVAVGVVTAACKICVKSRNFVVCKALVGKLK